MRWTGYQIGRIFGIPNYIYTVYAYAMGVFRNQVGNGVGKCAKIWKSAKMLPNFLMLFPLPPFCLASLPFFLGIG